MNEEPDGLGISVVYVEYRHKNRKVPAGLSQAARQFGQTLKAVGPEDVCRSCGNGTYLTLPVTLSRQEAEEFAEECRSLPFVDNVKVTTYPSEELERKIKALQVPKEDNFLLTDNVASEYR